MRKKRHTKLVHEGQYVAEVDVELIETDEGLVSVLVAGRCQQVGRCPCCTTSRRPKKCSALISCI